MADNGATVLIEGAQITFRNFAGKEGQYNREGDRNFAVILPETTAKRLMDDGWNVKRLKGEDCKDEDRCGDWYLTVSVKYNAYPPNVTMITTNKRTRLTEDMVDILDGMELSNVDINIRAYEWSVNGKTGIKAYLKTGFFTILEDELEMKYAHLDDPDYHE